MNKILNTSTFWRYLVYFWNIVFYIIVIADILYSNKYQKALEIAGVIFMAMLSIYAGTKEFERWFSVYKARHPGEVFVVSWTILIVLLIILPYILDNNYKLPDIIVYCYISVLTIFALTRRSRSLYQKKIYNHRENNTPLH
ncbi:MAG: hypothetical protein N2692_02725 [Patescibacteria group bacterium]|jgi:hypothetical protein|nr:hypothetical protein [Patescibacteria group bacterium]